MNKQPHILYKILVYSITIVGSLWLIYISINDFNQGILENKESNTPTFPVELMAASKLKAEGNDEAAEVLLKEYLVEHPKSFEGRMMLAELYFEDCMKDTLNCELALWNLTYMIEKYPKRQQPYIYRSDVYLKLGDSISAKADIDHQF